MLIKFTDVDEWKVQDFYNYIKMQCDLNHIEFEVDKKQSMMILGRTFKLLKLNNKSKSWLKKHIDTFVSSDNVSTVTSLLFINYLTRILPRKLQDNTIKNLPKVTEISETTKKRLCILRSCL